MKAEETVKGVITLDKLVNEMGATPKYSFRNVPQKGIVHIASAHHATDEDAIARAKALNPAFDYRVVITTKTDVELMFNK